MNQADTIRAYVLNQIIQPARERGERVVRVRADKVHAALNLSNRFPAVCSALDADKFLSGARVTLISRSGPKFSSSVEWVFGL